MIVADASVVLTALVDDGSAGDRARDRLRGQRVAAPEVVDLEVVSALRRGVGSGALGQRRALAAVRDLEVLAIERASHAPLLARCWALRDNVTPYDAAYVALAEALEVPLVTADEHLARSPGPVCEFEVLR